MGIEKNALHILADGIVNVVHKMIPNLPFDRSFQGRINQVLENNAYRVEVGGVVYTASSLSSSDAYVIGDQVWITAPQNNFSNLFIAGLRRWIESDVDYSDS